MTAEAVTGGPTHGDGADAAAMAIAAYRQQMRACSSVCDAVRTERAELEVARVEALADLVTRLLPEPDRASAERAARQTGAEGLADLADSLARERAARRRRLAEIEADPSYRDRERLTHPINGTYAKKIARCTARLRALAKRLEPFQIKSFIWLYHRGHFRADQPNAFESFLRTLTLTRYREERALKALAAFPGFGDFFAAAQKYEILRNDREAQLRKMERWRDERQKVLDLCAEYGRLSYQQTNHHGSALDRPRRALFEHLERADLAAMHARVDEDLRPAVAGCFAAAAKVRYLDRVGPFLEDQLRDRKRRVQLLARAESRWRASPALPLRGDRSRWLVDLPLSKAAELKDTLGWIHAIRLAVIQFEDDEAVCAALARGGAAKVLDLMLAPVAELLPGPECLRRVFPDEIGLGRNPCGTVRQGRA